MKTFQNTQRRYYVIVLLIVWSQNSTSRNLDDTPYYVDSAFKIVSLWFSRLWRRRWRKTSKLRVAGFVTGFPSQRASDAENVSIWWRHHGVGVCHLAAISVGNVLISYKTYSVSSNSPMIGYPHQSLTFSVSLSHIKKSWRYSLLCRQCF